MKKLGLGIGWRPELALAIDRRRDLGFVEIISENIAPARVPTALGALRQRGVEIIPHGISLSLGGAEPVDRKRVKHLAELAREFDAPLVSEHIAFVRADGIEAGHLLPLPRTRDAIAVLVDNVKRVQDLLPVPLALENIAALFEWPDGSMSEAEFLSEILDRTGTLLLLDLANVWANALNSHQDPTALLRLLPLDRLAYIHVAGGEQRDGAYHDTHAAPVPEGVLRLLRELAALHPLRGVMLERDDCFPTEDQLNLELDQISHAAGRRAD